MRVVFRNFFAMYMMVGAAAVSVCCVSCAQKEQTFVAMSPQQVEFIQVINSDYEKLLGLSRDEILMQLGKPVDQEVFVRGGIERERFVYYLYQKEVSDEKKVLEVYFIDDKVSGFNVIYGELYEDVKDKPLVYMNTVEALMK